ncbi:hypothetical protein MIR68_010265 [Amoeboaphelidium protococcarum]|nr:hypothetical protein MIR68_010265 [Amoeboaphelidium protococcarum]
MQIQILSIIACVSGALASPTKTEPSLIKRQGLLPEDIEPEFLNDDGLLFSDEVLAQMDLSQSRGLGWLKIDEAFLIREKHHKIYRRPDGHMMSDDGIRRVATYIGYNPQQMDKIITDLRRRYGPYRPPVGPVPTPTAGGLSPKEDQANA